MKFPEFLVHPTDREICPVEIDQIVPWECLSTPIVGSMNIMDKIFSIPTRDDFEE